MKRFGKGEKGILLVGSHPNQKDDRAGYSFAGRDGQLLRKHLKNLGIDLEKDCVRTSAVACTRENKPTVEQIKACSKNLMRDISEVQPKVIICLGDVAVKAVLDKPRALSKSIKGPLTASIMHGLSISSKKYGCWVTGSFAPDFFLHRLEDDRVPDDQNLLLFDLASALGQIGKPLAEPLGEEGNVLLDTVEDAVSAIKSLTSIKNPTAYDYETTELTPWKKGAKIVSLSFTDSIDSAYFIPLNFVNLRTCRPYFNDSEINQITEAWREFLESSTPKIVQNLNMEGCWDKVYFKANPQHWLHDTMLGAHVLHCRRSVCSLAFQVYHMVGHDYKSMVNPKDILSSHIEDLLHYNCWDSRYTLMAYNYQKPRLEKEGRLAEFFKFMFNGEKALLNLTCRGVPIDPQVLDQMQKDFQQEQLNLIEKMQGMSEVQRYVEEAKCEKFNPDSPPQLAAILKKVFRITPTKENKLKTTATGLLCTDKEALPRIWEWADDPKLKDFLGSILRFRKCCSVVERADNYWANMDLANKVHPSYYLLLNTFRSSSEDPNIQNVFKHDEELQTFRRCVVPSPGRIFMEVDESSLEVRVVAMASGDEELIRQIIAGVDPHRKWASLIFQIPEEEITKVQRYEAKNGFVFLSFYGGTWQAAARRFPTVRREHIRDVQRQFWNEFKGVKEWQNRTINTYRNLGFTEAVSGFRRYGPLNINKIYNTPIQGPGFHLLLNSLIRLDLNTEDLTAILDEKGFQSKPLFEIHDSLTFDTVPEEAYDLHKVVSDIMVDNYFDWQREIPMEVEWDVGHNWYDMYTLEERDSDLLVVMDKKKDEKVSLKEFCTV
jgi:DNA polymerase-1